MGAFDYYERMKPLIEKAAGAARRRAKRVSLNPYFHWMVYTTERNRLTDATFRFQKEETVVPDRWSEPMNREQFEEYLLSLGVWVEEDDEEETDGKRGTL